MVHCSPLPRIAVPYPVRLTLLVPELLWPEPGDKLTLDNLSCPGLEWLLARGQLRRGERLSHETALARLFGLAADAPFGALRLLGEPLKGNGPNARDGFWLCADPVHLRFHQERIVLADAGAFELSDDEAYELANALSREFADMGQFHVGEARRWYLRLNQTVTHDAAPLSAVAGRRMDGELPEAVDASPLRRWLNEIQMFLHGHPINSERQATGKPVINSLWLWGAGALPSGPAPAFAGVRADSPLPIGLARAARIPVAPLPHSLEAFLAAAPAPGEHLLVIEDLLAPVLYEDRNGWRAAQEALDKKWFAPLRRALAGPLTALTLVAPTIYGQLTWDIRAADRWKLWRRPQALASLADSLAKEIAP